MRGITLFAILVLGVGGLRAQQNEDVSLRVGRLHENKKNHTETEGDVIHLMIHHALGLKTEAARYLDLTKSEQSVTKVAAKAMLLEIERDLARRASELREKTSEIGAAKATSPGHAAPVSVEIDPNRAEGVQGGKIEVPAPPQEFIESVVGKVEPKKPEPSESAREKTKPAKSDRVIAIITGSGDHRAVGRVLFQAGKYKAALEELKYLEKDKKAPLAELFILARCNEELHKVARAKSETVDANAQKELANAAQAEVIALDMIKRKVHSVAVGGTYASAREYARLQSIVTKSRATAATLTSEFKLLRQESAKRFEKAYEILLLIEGRDLVKNSDAVEVLGEWGKAARSARNVMRWLDSKGRWVAPKPKWSGD